MGWRDLLFGRPRRLETRSVEIAEPCVVKAPTAIEPQILRASDQTQPRRFDRLAGFTTVVPTATIPQSFDDRMQGSQFAYRGRLAAPTKQSQQSIDEDAYRQMLSRPYPKYFVSPDGTRIRVTSLAAERSLDGRWQQVPQ